MSSVFGHALIGLAIGDNARKPGPRGALLFAGLAIAPDLDYLLLWFGGIQWEPRNTHSLAAALLLACLGGLLFRPLMRRAPTLFEGLLLLAAPLSHLLLDYLVGVHRNPLLWPLSAKLWAFDWGLLPSAGRFRLGNLYFWRNLVIEFGILLPVALFVSARGRQALKGRPLAIALALAMGLGLAIVGLGLKR